MRVFDQVRETATADGLDPFELLGRDGAANFEFGERLADGEHTLYAARLGAQSEVGLGRYEATGNLLVRVRVYANSEGDQALIDFAAGTARVWIDHPALLDMAASGVHLALARGIGIL